MSADCSSTNPRVQMTTRRTRIRRDRTAKERKRLHRIAALVAEQAQVVERPRILGCHLENPPVRSLRLGEAPRSVLGERASQLRFDGHTGLGATPDGRSIILPPPLGGGDCRSTNHLGRGIGRCKWRRGASTSLPTINDSVLHNLLPLMPQEPDHD